jgi:hypothetical protein
MVTVNGITYTAWDTLNVTKYMGLCLLKPKEFNNGGSPSINNWNISKVTNMLYVLWDKFYEDIGTKVLY